MHGLKNILKGKEFYFIEYSAGLHYLACLDIRKG